MVVPIIPNCVFIRLPINSITGIGDMGKISFLLHRRKHCISVPRYRVRIFHSVMRGANRFVRFTRRLAPKVAIQMAQNRLRKTANRLLSYRNGGGLVLHVTKLKYTLIAITSSTVRGIEWTL